MSFEALITFLTIENHTLNNHSDPWIKSDRDSICISCDVFLLLFPVKYCGKCLFILTGIIARTVNCFIPVRIYRTEQITDANFLTRLDLQRSASDRKSSNSSQSLASPTPSGLIAKVASPWKGNIYRVFFLTGTPLKVLSVRLHSKSHQKSVRIYLPKIIVILREGWM